MFTLIFSRVAFMTLSIFTALSIFATLPVFAASANDFADTSNDTSKVTLVFDHALPNVPGKSVKGLLVEYALLWLNTPTYPCSLGFYLCNSAGGCNS